MILLNGLPASFDYAEDKTPLAFRPGPARRSVPRRKSRIREGGLINPLLSVL